MKSSKKLEDFVHDKRLEKEEASGAFSHDTDKFKKKLPKEMEKLDAKDIPQKFKNIWFAKAAKKKKIAYYEVVAQELFRLFVPRQPKTRIIVDDTRDKFYVASKEIPGFKPLDEKKLKEDVIKGKIKGLGEMTLLSLFLNEVDLKNGNLGLDQHNQLVKIDGDWCFSELQGRTGNQNISENEIKQLPMPAGYAAYNWLGAIEMGVNILGRKIIGFEISTDPLFRDEVNQTILKVLVMPNELLKTFVDTYVEIKTLANNIYAEIISRKEQLRKAALQNLSFKDYCNSANSQKLLQEFIQDIKQFKTTKKNFLLKKQEDNKALPGKVELVDNTSIEKKAEVDKKSQLDSQTLASSSTKINLWLQDSANTNAEPKVNVSSAVNDKQKSDVHILTLMDGKQKSIEDILVGNYNTLKSQLPSQPSVAEQKITVSKQIHEDTLQEDEKLTSEERVLLNKILAGEDESDDLVLSNDSDVLKKILEEKNEDEDLVISNRAQKLQQILDEDESVEADENDELAPPVLKRQVNFKWGTLSEDPAEEDEKSKNNPNKSTFRQKT